MIDVEKIKTIPILDIAEKLGLQIFKGNKVLCFKGHDKNTPSLSFNINENYFNCFGCEIKGDNIELVREYLDVDFKEALNWFKENGFITAGGYTPKPRNKEAYRANMSVSKETKHGETYLAIYNYFISLLPFPDQDSYLIKERCLSYEVLEANNIKAIPEKEDRYFYQNKLLEKFSEKELLESGLLAVSKNGNSYFSFFDCDFIFPFYKDDNVIYLQGVFKDRAKKYKNLTGITKPLLFTPKQFKDYSGEVYITEGIIDSLSLLTESLNAVAIMDANITDLNGLEILKGFNNIILGDNDITGLKAEVKLYGYMLKNFYKVEALDIQNIAEKYQIKEKIKDANELIKKIREVEVCKS